ncbi:MAG: cell division protein SepF [Eubacteriales bacterium]|nr:cell division protein SepF [Eubacteriales bacterium]
MANVLEKLMKAMKLNENDNDDFEDELEFAAEEKIETPTTQNIRPARREPKAELERFERPVRTVNEVPSYRKSERKAAPSVSGPKTNVVNFQANVQMEVVVIQPATYDEAQVIADHIGSQRPVIVNLEKLDYSIAQRIMDFVSGAVYTLGGNLERVTQNIFIIAPENVDIAGHFQEELKSNGIILPWKSE